MTPTEAADAFLGDELDFFRKNIVFLHLNRGYEPSLHRAIQNFHIRHAPDELGKKNTYHWYSKSVHAYIIEPNTYGPIRAYVLGFADNRAIGMTLGVGAHDPRYMFTYRMDGCSFGYAQAGTGAAAYVSHHNDRGGGNNPLNIANQVPVLEPGANPVPSHPHGTVLNYFHKTGYMTGVHSGQFDTLGKYKATTFGVREFSGAWRFYTQVRKRQSDRGEGSHQWSLKGLVRIN